MHIYYVPLDDQQQSDCLTAQRYLLYNRTLLHPDTLFKVQPSMRNGAAPAVAECSGQLLGL
jgi:hypothetical protein